MPSDYSLSEVVRHWAQRSPGHVAVADECSVLTYAQWDALADLTARTLMATDVYDGDRVLYLGRNRATHPIVAAAASRVQAILVGANWRLSAEELAKILDDSEPKVAFVDVEFRPLFEAARGQTSSAVDPVWLHGAAGIEDLSRWSMACDVELPVLVPQPDDVAVLVYTSGTTGEPKGVMATNWQIGAAARRIAQAGALDNARFLLVLPLFHVSGLCWLTVVSQRGGTLVLLADASPASIEKAVCEHQVTDTMLVPALIQMLMDEPGGQPGSYASLRSMWYGGSAISLPVLQRMTTYFAGVQFHQGYGMSETNGPICMLSAEDHRDPGDNLASVGRPLPGIDIQIVDPDTGEVVDSGQIGEVRTRSEQNCLGYWRRPEETRKLLADRWLRTGDLGYVATDCLFLVGRLNDRIITAGENVYAGEVEAAIAELPGVVEACVVGIPDYQWGETVAAAISLDGTGATEADQIIDQCRTKLAHYKCPTRVVLISALPRNATGKVIRNEVIAMFDAVSTR